MKIFGIIILYNCTIQNSKTLISLKNNYDVSSHRFRNFSLIIYDNGSDKQEMSDFLPFECNYYHASENKGLAVAYNYALNIASSGSYNWLLLLDQDSSLPDFFIDELFNEVTNNSSNERIYAFAPKMKYNNFFFSPSKVLFGGIHRPIEMYHYGIYPSEIFAIGSCSLLKVSFFKQLGGFNEIFWLDCLDRWIYLQIHKHCGKVFIIKSEIEHELSVLDYTLFVSKIRYNNIMKYESLFMDCYKSWTENLVYYFRLIFRSVKFLFSKKTRQFSILTIRHLIKILIMKRRFLYN